MNEIVNTFLLAGDKFMPDMHLKQPRFTYSAFRPFTKNNERIQEFKETGDTIYIYKNELDKAYSQHDMAYGDFKDLKRRTASNNTLRDKAFNIAKNLKYDGYQRGLASMVYKLFDRKSTSLTDKYVSGIGVNTPLELNEQLAEELHKLIIRNFKKIHNEGKSVVAEKFIRALKTKIYKYMTLVSKNMYIDKLNNIGG